jgi:hypothetical protein
MSNSGNRTKVALLLQHPAKNPIGIVSNQMKIHCIPSIRAAFDQLAYEDAMRG